MLSRFRHATRRRAMRPRRLSRRGPDARAGARFATLRAVAFAFALLAAGAVAAAGAAAETLVHGVRIGPHDGKTRLILEMDGPARFSILLLADPYRVALDLPETGFASGFRRPAAPLGGVAGYRFDSAAPGAARITVDLARPMTVAAAFRPEPRGGTEHRLIVDLEEADRPTFLAASAESMRERTAARRGRAPEDDASSGPEDGGAPKPGGKRIVVVDPGHGGADPGAVGAGATQEKWVALAAARVVGEALEATGRYEVALTRKRDVFVSLRRRVAIARAAEADLFLSIHADAAPAGAARGASVYTLSETASDEEAARLAERENRADSFAGLGAVQGADAATGILIDLARRETMGRSARFAGFLAEELRAAVPTRRPVHRFAGFAVLKAPDIPSALLEIGYLSNREEEGRLRRRAFHEKLAAAIRRAADRFFEATRRTAAR